MVDFLEQDLCYHNHDIVSAQTSDGLPYDALAYTHTGIYAMMHFAYTHTRIDVYAQKQAQKNLCARASSQNDLKPEGATAVASAISNLALLVSVVARS
jgi:hypothetical protein